MRSGLVWVAMLAACSSAPPGPTPEPPGPLPTGAPRTLGALGTMLSGFTGDDTDLFYVRRYDTKDFGLNRLSRAGGEPVELWRGSDLSGSPSLSATHVYFGVPGGVRRVPKSGGDAGVVVAVPGLGGSTWVQGVRVHEGSVYWSSTHLGGMGQLGVVPLEGSDDAGVLLTGTRQGTVKILDGELYWLEGTSSDDVSIRAMPLAGGTPRTVAGPMKNVQSWYPEPDGLWLLRLVQTSTTQWEVVHLPYGGEPRQLAKDFQLKNLNLHGGWLYWVNGMRRTVEVLPRSGGDAGTLFTDVQPEYTFVDDFGLHMTADGGVLTLFPFE